MTFEGLLEDRSAPASARLWRTRPAGPLWQLGGPKRNLEMRNGAPPPECVSAIKWAAISW